MNCGAGQGQRWSPHIPLEEKLYRVHYEVDQDHPHIRLVEVVCKECTRRVCTFICPAGVYLQDEQGRITVRHENCLECGTCRIACPKEGIVWEYPSGGMGVRYRFG
jgi:ferredoxin like protein